MGWLELLKSSLNAIVKIVTDIPVWAKTVICLLVFATISLVVAANIRQMFVFRVGIAERSGDDAESRYQILHIRSGYTTPYQRSNDDLVKASIPVRIGLFEELGREFEILRRTTTAGQGAPRAPFEFSGSRPLQSDLIDVSVLCDFTANPKAKCETSNGAVSRRQRDLVAPSSAEAAEPERLTLSAPTVETLREVAPAAGYMEVRFDELRVKHDRCGKDCSAALFRNVEWNGIQLLFDGIPAEASRTSDVEVTAAGEIRQGVAFGIENTLFRVSDNMLRVSFYARQPFGSGFRRYEQLVTKGGGQLVDVFETPVEMLRVVTVRLTGKQGVITGRMQIRSVTGSGGRSRELFVGGGTLDEVTVKRDFINTRLAKQVTLDGNSVLAVVRPPLTDKNRWGLAVGVSEVGTERIRVLLSEEEARALLAQFRHLPDSQLGPLRKDEFFIQRVASTKD